jgi:hypothetical protein
MIVVFFLVGFAVGVIFHAWWHERDQRRVEDEWWLGPPR